MDIEYATTGIQPEVSFIMQLIEEDADKSSSEEESDDYVGEATDIEGEESRPRVRLQRDQLHKRSSPEKTKKRDIRCMVDHDSQTVMEFEHIDCQAGPSTFLDFKDVGCSSFVRREDAEVQVESRVKHSTTQTKVKFKEIGVQNKIMQSMQVETETQVELEMHNTDTQTDIKMEDQSTQVC
jgi:hypothetical protein